MTQPTVREAAERLIELWRRRAAEAARDARRGSFSEGNCAQSDAFNLVADELEAALSIELHEPEARGK